MNQGQRAHERTEPREKAHKCPERLKTQSIPCIRRALISCFDQNGLVDFASRLNRMGIEIVASEGTARCLTDHGLDVLSVAEHYLSPQRMGGRVKTLSSPLHTAILARRNNVSDARELQALDIVAIDLVVCNVYPVGSHFDGIDIGGPALIRSAAKNWQRVGVVTSPASYGAVASELETSQKQLQSPEAEQEAVALTDTTRRNLARQAFELTARLDASIATTLFSHGDGVCTGTDNDSVRTGTDNDSVRPDATNEVSRLELSLSKKLDLCYGENPGTKAALYQSLEATSPEDAGKGHRGSERRHSDDNQRHTKFELQKGRDLSYNNLLDAEAAWTAVAAWELPCACVVKHARPCGLALAEKPLVALEKALDGDVLSSYGGILALSFTFDQGCARLLLERRAFLEVICAPDFEPGALELMREKKRLRCLRCGPLISPRQHVRTSIFGTFIQRTDAQASLPEQTEDAQASLPEQTEDAQASLPEQTEDAQASLPEQTEDAQASSLALINVGTTSFPEERRLDVTLAWRAVSLVCSNAIVLVRDLAIVGVGGGAAARVDAVEQAIGKAGDRSLGAILVSDGFFPFPDGVDACADSGCVGIVQPGGSKRDAIVTARANGRGIFMVHTGQRVFKH